MGWKPISYASRFLTELEAKFSINELELLAVVWAIEHFKNYVYGETFGVVSDHKALQSVLKANKGNKTFSSRLTRWVDRLLPFDFSVIHAPGRTIGLADYLSRHPSEYCGSTVKAEEMFNSWFTINVVDEIVPPLKKKPANKNEPIRFKLDNKRNESENDSVLTIHTPTQLSAISKQKAKQRFNDKMAEAKDLSKSKISQFYIQANYENDRNIQKIISLVKDKNPAVISRLPPPWGEKFNSCSLDSKNLLYMDQRLVIPKDMRENVLRAIHFGHAGRDAMLREASDVWWPRIHREIVEKAQSCTECQKAGKNLKCINSQKEFGKIPEAKNPNDEISLDFAGPFQNAYKQKKYLLVSVDNNSGWPDAMFLPNPSAEKVVEFLVKYIATNGIPKRIRTDPGTVFKGEKFQQFCKERFIRHIICPIRDHRGNGKVERMIRTVNERLRTNRKIVVQKDTSGLSNILFALRTEKGVDNTSAYERQMGRKPNTLKSAMIRKCILEKDPQLQIEPDDFSEEADSTILVRERVKGTKLEGNFKKIKGQVIHQSENTLTVLPKGGKETIYSKRDVAKLGQSTSSAKKETAKKKSKFQEKPAKQIQPIGRESTSSSEMGQIPKMPQEEQLPNITIEQHSEEEDNARQKFAEKEASPEQAVQIKEARSEIEEQSEKEEEMGEKQEEKKVPIKGSVKWDKEKAPTRSSKRRHKKPNWLGNNIMVTRVEPEATGTEESFPSVFEVEPFEQN